MATSTTTPRSTGTRRPAGAAPAPAAKPVDWDNMPVESLLSAIDEGKVKFSDLSVKTARRASTEIARRAKSAENGSVIAQEIEEREDGSRVLHVSVELVQVAKDANKFVPNPAGKANNNGTKGDWVPRTDMSKLQYCNAKAEVEIDGNLVPLTVYCGLKVPAATAQA